MSLLTGELKRLGFRAYIQNTGKYTSLIIEERRRVNDTIYACDFYKVNFYKDYISRATAYGKHLAPFQLLKRIKNCIYYREKYLKERRTIT